MIFVKKADVIDERKVIPMKKAFFGASLLLLIGLMIVFFYRDYGLSNSNRIEDLENFDKLYQNAIKVDEQLKIQLEYENVVLPYDAKDNTFFLPLDLEQPELILKLLTEKNNGKLYSRENPDKWQIKQFMEDNTTIPLLIQKDNQWYQANLCFTGLSILSFDATQDFIGDSNVFDLAVYEPGKAALEYKQLKTMSRVRGNTSKSYEKLSLRLNLVQKKDNEYKKHQQTLLGMRSDDDWILNALYADRSRIRDKLSIDLWNVVAAKQNPYHTEFGFEADYVEVFINHAYQGIYLLMSPVDAKQLNMDPVSEQKEASAPVIERIYKKRFTTQWNPADFQGTLVDPKMPDYRGGFFLKGDDIQGSEEEFKPLLELSSCITSDSKTFKNQIANIVDTENTLDYWLFIQAIAGFDNYGKNYYYIVKNKNNSPFGYFIPWDMNLSFGDVYAENEFYSKTTDEFVNEFIPWEPANRMISEDVMESRERVSSKWKLWRETAFSDEELTQRVQSLQNLLEHSGALKREGSRWPSAELEETDDFIQSFAKKRCAFLDQALLEEQRYE